MSDWKSEWKWFARNMGEPPHVLLVLGALALVTIGVLTVSSYSRFAFGLLAMVPAVALGRRLERFAVSTQLNVVAAARGETSVRNLQLLVRRVGALDDRVNVFLKSQVDTPNDVTRRNYEELGVACRLMREDAVTAIEFWKDLLPSADVQAQFQSLAQLRKLLDTNVREKEVLQSKLNGDAKSAGDREQIVRGIDQREENIAALQQKLAETQSSVRWIAQTNPSHS